jgi:hypothetical protein
MQLVQDWQDPEAAVGARWDARHAPRESAPKSSWKGGLRKFLPKAWAMLKTPEAQLDIAGWTVFGIGLSMHTGRWYGLALVYAGRSVHLLLGEPGMPFIQWVFGW